MHAPPCARDRTRRRGRVRARDRRRPAAADASAAGAGPPRAASSASRGIGLHLATPAARIEPGAMIAADGSRIAADAIVWTTGAAALPWLRELGVALDAAGFVAVNESLQSISDERVFAAGDCATMIAQPRPRSGVFAVRQGPPLAANLRAALAGRPLVRYVPQSARSVADLDRGPPRRRVPRRLGGRRRAGCGAGRTGSTGGSSRATPRSRRGSTAFADDRSPLVLERSGELGPLRLPVPVPRVVASPSWR